MKIRVHRNYQFPNFYQQSPKNKGIWNGIEFTTEPIENCDYFIALNPPNIEIHIRVPKGNKWLFLQEPPVEEFAWYTKSFQDFDTVFGFWEQKTSRTKSFGSTKIISEQTALPWHIQKSYDELITLEIGQKRKEISWITSNLNIRQGHKTRMQFLQFLQEKNYPFHLYGRGFQPITDKFDALYPYQYSIAIENYFCRDYWTEKIADCFLSWTMPIYAGATNITDYFPKESMIIINPTKPKEALDIIQKAIDEDAWQQNFEAIKKARDLILNKYQFFPHIANLIKANPSPSVDLNTYTIPPNLAPKRTFTDKLRQLFLWQ